MIRFTDLLISIALVIFAFPVLLVVLIMAYLDTGHPIFAQVRVGRRGCAFVLYKFRTMHVATESRPTHLVNADSVTRFGYALRKYKLDELPQLFNVIKGDMSLVGPRPCLESQLDVIKERNKLGVNDFLPGITGLSQLNGIDMSNPVLLAETDKKMLEDLTYFKYIKYLLLTFLGKGSGDKVNRKIG